MTLSLSDYDCFVFDCDGVLWHGESPIEGAIETVRKLKAAGKHVYFVTNASKRSQVTVYEKFIRLGFDGVDLHDVYPSGYFAAAYLRETYPNAERLYVIGGAGLVEELTLKGFHVQGGPADTDYTDVTEENFKVMADQTGQYDGVVVGFDSGFNYMKLCKASLALQSNPDSFLCATNEDSHLQVGRFAMPGNGSMATILKYCMETACKPVRKYIVTGKPDPRIIDFVLGKCGVEKARCVMIGDRLDTDIQLANNAGIKGCMVLTGCSTIEEICDSTAKPDYVAQSVAVLLKDD